MSSSSPGRLAGITGWADRWAAFPGAVLNCRATVAAPEGPTGGSGCSCAAGAGDGSAALPRTSPEADSCTSFCFDFVLFLRSPLLPLPDERRPDLPPEPFADASLLRSLSLLPFFDLVVTPGN